MTTPQQVLSDYERTRIVLAATGSPNYSDRLCLDVEEAVLAKLQASPQAQPEQAAQGVGEVVARTDSVPVLHRDGLYYAQVSLTAKVPQFTDLYTHPAPSAAVVDLTDEQLDALVEKHARALWSSSQQDWDVAEFNRLGLLALIRAALTTQHAQTPKEPS